MRKGRFHFYSWFVQRQRVGEEQVQKSCELFASLFCSTLFGFLRPVLAFLLCSIGEEKQEGRRDRQCIFSSLCYLAALGERRYSQVLRFSPRQSYRPGSCNTCSLKLLLALLLFLAKRIPAQVSSQVSG